MGGDGSQPIQKHAVTLWDLLTLLSWSGAMAGALSVAAQAKVSRPGFVLLGFWGAVLGIGCVALARSAGHQLTEAAARRGERWIPLAYLALLAWLFGAFALAFFSSRLVLRVLP